MSTSGLMLTIFFVLHSCSESVMVPFLENPKNYKKCLCCLLVLLLFVLFQRQRVRRSAERKVNPKAGSEKLEETKMADFAREQIFTKKQHNFTLATQ